VAAGGSGSGESTTPKSVTRGSSDSPTSYGLGAQGRVACPGDTGGASRFFPTIEWTGEDLDFIRFRYCPKASRSERTCGGAVENRHPTVKPVALMRWLVGLVARPGQLVLDPFAGSGTTGIAAAREGLRYILIEQDAGHAATARKRIAGGPLLAGS